MSNGLLFGPWPGAAHGLAGTPLGATGLLLVVRAGLIDLARTVAAGIAAGFRAHALRYLAVPRLVPMVPFTRLKLAAALAGLTGRNQVLATAIGIRPSAVICASLSHLLMDPARHGQVPDASLLWQPKLLLPMLGLALLALLPLLLACEDEWR